MMNNEAIDWVGRWFPFIEANGEFAKITFIRTIPDFKTFHIEHRLSDGIGGLEYLLKEAGHTNIILPTLKDPKPPGLLRNIFNFLACSLDNRKRNEAWRFRDITQKGKEIELTWHTFSKEQTAKIIEYSNKNGVSYNSTLLFILNNIVRNRLLRDTGTNWWMIPVNMRGALNIKSNAKNLASYISAKVNPEDTLSRLHLNISKKLKRKYHFAAWYSLNIGKLIGLKGMKRIIDSFHTRNHSWCGTLSNLGQWNTANDDEVWLFAPPITKAHPVGAGLTIFNGKLSIAMQIHPSISIDQVVTREIMESWKDKILLTCS